MQWLGDSSKTLFRTDLSVHECVRRAFALKVGQGPFGSGYKLRLENEVVQRWLPERVDHSQARFRLHGRITSVTCRFEMGADHTRLQVAINSDFWGFARQVVLLSLLPCLVLIPLMDSETESLGIADVKRWIVVWAISLLLAGVFAYWRVLADERKTQAKSSHLELCEQLFQAERLQVVNPKEKWSSLGPGFESSVPAGWPPGRIRQASAFFAAAVAAPALMSAMFALIPDQPQTGRDGFLVALGPAFVMLTAGFAALAPESHPWFGRARIAAELAQIVVLPIFFFSAMVMMLG
jgi:hypothetical protein